MNRFSKSKRPSVRGTAVSLAVLSLCGAAQAQTSDSTPMRIEITGSLIKRVADEGALPVTTVRAEELQARGHTEMKDFMLELPQANSLGSNAGTAGPMTSLRGFGPMRTLTLLNGRRLAKEPLSNQYVSVSIIPRMALSRTDILRDGASSAYGSDAISGVQAFYTLRSYNGAGIKVEALVPQRDGGGDEQSVGLIGGIGKLASDGWNIFGAMEIQKRKILLREERPELVDPAIIRQMGGAVVPGLGSVATPANFNDPTNPTAASRSLLWNPYFVPAVAPSTQPTGCLPPYSEPSTASGRRTCFLDTNDTYTAFGNGSDILTVYGKGSLRMGDGHTLSAEYNLGKFMVLQNNQATNTLTSATNPTTVRLTSDHPFYPGNTGANSRGVPLPAGLTAAALGGRPIDVLWSVADLGPREREDYHTNQRIVFSLEGQVAGFDYQTGLNHGWAERDTRAGKGWVSISGLATQRGTGTTLFLDPRLNPFGLQDAAGLAVLNAASLEGRTIRVHKSTNTSLDFTLSGELFPMAGGSAALAVGSEIRRDGWEAVGLVSNDPKASLNGLVDIFGGDNQAPGAGSSTSNKISRLIGSSFAELEMPVTKTLSFNAALRADKYSDLDKTTVNPKLAVRWAPSKATVFRASVNTGFRAPALPEIYSKETERTSLALFNDPLYCAAGTPTNGYTAAQVCGLTGRNQITKVPNNQGIDPEKSRSFTLGAAFEPTRGVSVAIDYWNTEIKDVIGNRGISFILSNPTLYPNLFNRGSDGLLLSDAVTNTPTNLGKLRGSGIDTRLGLAFVPEAGHRVTFTSEVAYLLKWEASTPEVNNGAWVSALGQYNDVVPVNPNAGLSNATRGFNNRWRHTASVAWASGPWGAQLSHRYQSGLRDQNLPARTTGVGGLGLPRNVEPYEQFNFTASYSGIKNLKLGFGIQNLFNDQPPLTNHNGYTGYLTSSVDVLGRAYRGTVEYKF